MNLGLDETLYLLSLRCSFIFTSFLQSVFVWFYFPLNGREYVNRFLRIN